jgi:hypothetical protein
VPVTNVSGVIVPDPGEAFAGVIATLAIKIATATNDVWFNLNMTFALLMIARGIDAPVERLRGGRETDAGLMFCRRDPNFRVRQTNSGAPIVRLGTRLAPVSVQAKFLDQWFEARVGAHRPSDRLEQQACLALLRNGINA